MFEIDIKHPNCWGARLYRFGSVDSTHSPAKSWGQHCSTGLTKTFRSNTGSYLMEALCYWQVTHKVSRPTRLCTLPWPKAILIMFWACNSAACVCRHLPKQFWLFLSYHLVEFLHFVVSTVVENPAPKRTTPIATPVSLSTASLNRAACTNQISGNTTAIHAHMEAPSLFERVFVCYYPFLQISATLRQNLWGHCAVAPRCLVPVTDFFPGFLAHWEIRKYLDTKSNFGATSDLSCLVILIANSSA